MAGYMNRVEEYPPEVAKRVAQLRARIKEEEEMMINRMEPVLKELMDIDAKYPSKMVFVPDSNELILPDLLSTLRGKK